VAKLLAAGADPTREEADVPLTAAVRTCDSTAEGRPATSDCLICQAAQGFVDTAENTGALLPLGEHVRLLRVRGWFRSF